MSAIRVDQIAVYKPIGVSSHQIAILFSKKLGTVVTHTGNLDPMAEGVLVLLVGPEALKRQAMMQSADKEYELDLLFGISTDSYDSLGIVTDAAACESPHVSKEKLTSVLKGLIGKKKQAFPPYSAKVVKGRPLFWWARQGRMDEIGLPVHDIRIFDAELLALQEITASRLRSVVVENVSRVVGDFRQDRILAAWEAVFNLRPNGRFTLATVRLAVSAGTYVRSIAHDLGKEIGTPASALRIKRTRNGDVCLSDCERWND